jgi:methylmalonyl-CoA mutase N-terminal domain/subunit
MNYRLLIWTACLRCLGLPGEYPYTRGVQSNMYRGRFWTMRQYAGFGNAAESNARYKFLIAQGQTGLSVAFDLPTQIGYDATTPSPRAKWARWASPSPACATCRPCSTASRWTR